MEVWSASCTGSFKTKERDHGTRRRVYVDSAPKRKTSCLYWESNPCCPSRSQSLHWQVWLLWYSNIIFERHVLLLSIYIPSHKTLYKVITNYIPYLNNYSCMLYIKRHHWDTVSVFLQSHFKLVRLLIVDNILASCVNGLKFKILRRLQIYIRMH
jgi:hypothetical protein